MKYRTVSWGQGVKKSKFKTYFCVFETYYINFLSFGFFLLLIIMPIIIRYHILDALCYWQPISPLARVQVKLITKPGEKEAVIKRLLSGMHARFSKFTLFKQNKSKGSEAEKGENVFEDISGILLRQVIPSWNQWQLDWQDLTRIGPWNRSASEIGEFTNSWNRNLIGEFLCTCCRTSTYCQCWLLVAIGELERLNISVE